MQSEKTAEILLTVEQVAELLNVAPKTIRKWVYMRQIPFKKVGKRFVRFRRTEIASWIERTRPQ
jgi:excisionase family DNA binding protein